MSDTVHVGGRVDLTARFLVDAEQLLTVTATGGTLGLTHGGRTGVVPWDATCQDVERALPGTQCSGGPLSTAPVRVRWTGANGKTRQPPIIVVATELEGTAEVTVEVTGGVINLDAPPTVTVQPPAGGSVAVDAVDMGGGVYQAEFVPASAGVHVWHATGESTLHGPVVGHDRFTATA